MFDKIYPDWTHRRVKKIIEHFGHQAFFEKTVLDLGCGDASISGALSRLGARVIAVDARQKNLDIAKKKYPHITTMCVDLDQKWPFADQQFDYVLNIGLICHLTNYRQVLQKSCQIARNLIVESEICDSNDPTRIVQIDEHHSVYDWAINGVGNKPSAAFVEQVLSNCGMHFQRFDQASLNTGPFKYDWKVEGSGHRKIGHRRFWVASRDVDAKIIETATFATPAPTSPHRIELTPQIGPIITQPKSRKSKDKFKVAVCISGHMRNFDKTFERLFINLLKGTNPDIFVHTWEFVGTPLRAADASLLRVSTNSLLSKINKLYKPEKIVIEPQIRFPTDPLMHQKNFERRDINGVLSMFYKIKACNDLKKAYEKEHNFTYDCVVRVRPDLMFMSPFYVGPDMNTNKLYVPAGYDYGGINDQVAYGSSEIMDRYSLIYDNIQSLLIGGAPFNPEKLLDTHIKKMGLPLERSNLHYYIKRSNH